MAEIQYYINNLFHGGKSMYYDERDGTLKCSDDQTFKNRWVVEMERKSQTKAPSIYCNIRSVQNNGYLDGEKKESSTVQKANDDSFEVTVTQDKGSPKAKGFKTWILENDPEMGIKTRITNAENNLALTFDDKVVTAAKSGQTWLFQRVKLNTYQDQNK